MLESTSRLPDAFLDALSHDVHGGGLIREHFREGKDGNLKVVAWHLLVYALILEVHLFHIM